MNIIIHCDQTDCEFNHKEYPPIGGRDACWHPKPHIVTTFGKTISDTIRKCHSKSVNHANNT
jgi:hypothetical protein